MDQSKLPVSLYKITVGDMATYSPDKILLPVTGENLAVNVFLDGRTNA